MQRLRRERQLSLPALAASSGLSVRKLAEVEAGVLTPTVGALWKIATALGVPFSSLLQRPPREFARGATRALLTSAAQERAAHRRSLLPLSLHARGCTEVHELKLAAHAGERAPVYASRTLESLLVTAGRVIAQTEGEQHVLEAGDSLVLWADRARWYRNAGESEAVVYALIAPARTAARTQP